MLPRVPVRLIVDPSSGRQHTSYPHLQHPPEPDECGSIRWSFHQQMLNASGKWAWRRRDVCLRVAPVELDEEQGDEQPQPKRSWNARGAEGWRVDPRWRSQLKWEESDTRGSSQWTSFSCPRMREKRNAKRKMAALLPPRFFRQRRSRRPRSSSLLLRYTSQTGSFVVELDKVCVTTPTAAVGHNWERSRSKEVNALVVPVQERFLSYCGELEQQSPPGCQDWDEVTKRNLSGRGTKYW